ncbi:hypothetical protein GKZ68_01355 [Hymenobacter sp. BRD128]|uniref:hypothetical protein n=1 Tax=Hymenobacter sp. BRD128 TaxID=2675878 RepID=UPI001564D3DE|nr:hypothetical protein [Hymenobacter sp. BRD128]QKG55402.1 hypothetical protein GKZ68_01355 [Hymenobacter sp. BRD128]
MKITHRAPADASASLSTAAEPTLGLRTGAGSLDKAPRLSCCCRLSELLPLVRQVHDAARAARLASASQPGVAA